jgi:hypothetical protein
MRLREIVNICQAIQMNTLDYYDRQKAEWGSKEVDELREEYDTKTLNIHDIADIHKRTPGSIAYKLKSMGIIMNASAARGYSEYKSGELYKEVVKNGKSHDKPLGMKHKSTIVISSSAEINELREEINSLKSDVAKILSLMTVIYNIKSM